MSTVAGVIVGNSQERVEVFRQEEASPEGQYTEAHYMSFGVAIPSYVLCGLNSRLLGMTIGEHLQK